MNERIIRIVERHRFHGIDFVIAETIGEFGPHFMMFINGEPGYHSVDLENVQEYMDSLTNY